VAIYILDKIRMNKDTTDISGNFVKLIKEHMILKAHDFQLLSPATYTKDPDPYQLFTPSNGYTRLVSPKIEITITGIGGQLQRKKRLIKKKKKELKRLNLDLNKNLAQYKIDIGKMFDTLICRDLLTPTPVCVV
jgi:hypothetical protein